MAFEDRSSPSTAVSPSNDLSQSTINSPNSPESTRTSSYTCRTVPTLEDIKTYYQPYPSITPENDRPTFFRITAFALSHQSQPQSIARSVTPPRRNQTPPLCLRSPTSPTNDSCRSYSHSESSRSSPQPDELIVDDDDNNLPRIQTLKYSIRNILQPDFGKNAVQRTRAPPRIGYKPYEQVSESFEPAPLGNLCHAVAQIGKVQPNLNNHEARRCSTESRPPSPEKSVMLPSTDNVKTEDGDVPKLWPAWVYCTRYSDRPSSGPRSKRAKKPPSAKPSDDKRPRTAFSGAQLARLKHEFAENRYLTERRRQQLSGELGLNEAQIKIWFQNKRAKIKKSSGQKNPLALQLMAQGLYNHSTMSDDEADMPSLPGGPEMC